MAAADVFTSPGKLFVMPDTITNYATQGTSIGDVKSAVTLGWSHDMQFYSSPMSGTGAGTIPTSASVLGTQATLEVVVLEHIAEVASLAFQRRNTGAGFAHGGSYTYGDLIVPRGGNTTPLLFRPDDDSHDALLLPAAVVTSVGPYQFGDSATKLQDATVLTIVALWDSTLSANAIQRPIANLPTFNPE